LTLAPKLLVDVHVGHLHGTVVRLVVTDVGLTVVVVVLELRGDARGKRLRVVTEETIESIILIVVIIRVDVVSTLGIEGNGGPLGPGILSWLESIIDAVGPVESTDEAIVGDLNVLDVNPGGDAVPEPGLRVQEVVVIKDDGEVAVVLDHIVAIRVPELNTTISGPVEDVGVSNKVGVGLGPVSLEVIGSLQSTVGVAPKPRECTELDTNGLGLDGILGESRNIRFIESLSKGIPHNGKGYEKNAHLFSEMYVQLVRVV